MKYAKRVLEYHMQTLVLGSHLVGRGVGYARCTLPVHMQDYLPRSPATATRKVAYFPTVSVQNSRTCRIFFRKNHLRSQSWRGSSEDMGWVQVGSKKMYWKSLRRVGFILKPNQADIHPAIRVVPSYFFTQPALNDTPLKML